MDRKSAATYPTDNSKPIEDYETICLLAEEETKYNISLQLLMILTTKST